MSSTLGSLNRDFRRYIAIFANETLYDAHDIHSRDRSLTYRLFSNEINNKPAVAVDDDGVNGWPTAAVVAVAAVRDNLNSKKYYIRAYSQRVFVMCTNLLW